MKDESRLGLGLKASLVCAALLGFSCSSGGLRPRRDAAPTGSGGTTTNSSSASSGGGTTTASGGQATGGVAFAGGSAGSTFGTGGATGTTTAVGAGGAGVDAWPADAASADAAPADAPLADVPPVDGPPVDVAVADAPTSDDASPPLVDGPNGLAVLDPDYVLSHFYDLVQGTWLLGWYGGQDHFSWIRYSLSMDSSGSLGTLAVVAEPAISAGVPYLTCNGAGTWMLLEWPGTMDMRTMPAGCAREVLRWDWMRPVAWPGRAFLEASITSTRAQDGALGSTTTLTALKFPDDQCDAAFTTCQQPY